MRLKNYNEDLVLETVKVVLKDRPEVKPTRGFILDVAAFTLNRIPPKYITSERGLTRELMLTNGNGGSYRLLNIIELIAIINRGIDIVARRRHEHAAATKARTAAGAAGEPILGYFYNMPHIFGRLVDARTGSPVVEGERHALGERPALRARGAGLAQSLPDQRADQGVFQLLAAGRGRRCGEPQGGAAHRLRPPRAPAVDAEEER